jgi:hypothetical protein
MKDRLVSTDCRNDQLENQYKNAEVQLADFDRSVATQKDLEVKLRRDMEVQQEREVRRERQIEELIIEN